ncbi:MAG: hypothetical protein ACTSVO_06915 [Candidatus Heimdallarchaeaceae archaeon]
MSLRIFSVNKDGSFLEVPSEKDSFLHGDGAYLIVDRKEKKIFIYRKMGISSALAYSAARAATNLNTQKGSKYKVINIEEDEKDRILPSLYQKLDVSIPSEIKESRELETVSRNIVYGEKTIPVFKKQSYSSSVQTTKQERELQPVRKILSVEKDEESYRTQNIEELVKTLANQILFETKLDKAKKMEKPARHILKAEMVKKIDSLLDSIYEEDV